MSLLVVTPDFLVSAAADLEDIRSALTQAHSAAAVPTTGLAAAAGDEVSAAVAKWFGGFGQEFQALSTQANAFHQQFTQVLSSGAGSYLTAEAANASPLQSVEQDLLGVINAPTELLLGRPLIGDGTAGTSTNPNGGAGGLLYGNGGTGYSPTTGNGGVGGAAGFIGTGGNGGHGGTGGFGGAAGRGGLLFGADGTAGASGPAAPNATVPLSVFSTTEPTINLSVNGGKTIPVLVDTGSEGLVVPLKDVGFQHLGLPTGFGTSAYSGGLVYVYASFHTSVDFGGGIVSSPTDVKVVLFSFPTTFSSFLAGDGSEGILGIGPNATGPGTTNPTNALPGNLSQGVLINQPAHQLSFGSNTIPGGGTQLNGSPITNVNVKVVEPTTTYTENNVPTIVDSGGVYGTMPSSVVGATSGGLPAGTHIYVTTTGGTPLYDYVVNSTNSPTITTDALMNTGNIPFAQHEVYISNSPSGSGTTYIDA